MMMDLLSSTIFSDVAIEQRIFVLTVVSTRIEPLMHIARAHICKEEYANLLKLPSTAIDFFSLC
jgi:hypothetical protein